MQDYYTRSFLFEGETCVALPSDSGLWAGDEVLLYLLDRAVHLLRGDAPDEAHALSRKGATQIVPSTMISVPDEVIPAL